LTAADFEVAPIWMPFSEPTDVHEMVKWVWNDTEARDLSIKLPGTMTICYSFQPKLRNHLGEGSRCSGQRLGHLAALRCLDIAFDGQAS